MRTFQSILALTAFLTLAGCTGVEKPMDTGLPVDNDGDGVFAADDCDDENAEIHPEAEEICDSVDNDCDGETDESDAVDATTWYQDADGDGYGSTTLTETACEAPISFVDNDTDCDDLDSDFHPGATEDDCTDSNDYNCDGSVAYEDADADGFPACEDCDDSTAATNDNGEETCDGVDNDCDGTIDEPDATDAATWYADSDGDGHGDASVSQLACTPPSGTVDNDTDCDDTTAATSPAASEICDSVDNDCDGTTDEPDAVDAVTWYADSDGDGHGDAAQSQISCVTPSAHVDTSDDCDDGNALISPSADEQCNTVDDDCDGSIDESDAIDETVWYADTDSDGHGDPNTTAISCDAPTGHVATNDDCDDQAAAVNPAAVETCDTIDNDCDGVVDENDATDALVGYLDYDDDGFGGQAIVTTACILPSGYVLDSTDCDDTDSDANPGAAEVCTDSADNNCDGTINEATAIDASTWYLDTDGDGHGDSTQSQQSCDQPTGYALLDGDCNESDPNIHPSATEISGNGIDDNCANDLPIIQSVTLSHTSAYTDTVLTAAVVAEDPEGEPLVLSYEWVVDNVLQSVTDNTLDGATAFDKDQSVSVDVTVDDGTDQVTTSSDTLVVLNTAPAAPIISIDPPFSQAGESDLTCYVDTPSTDLDGDAVTYTVVWTADGVTYTAGVNNGNTGTSWVGPSTTHWTDDTVLAADTVETDEWICTVTPYDDDEAGSTASTTVDMGFELTIASNTLDYDPVAVLSTSTDWDGTSPVAVRILIESGVVVGSSDATLPAIVTSGLPAGSALEILNSGTIQGKGGDGGQGATAQGYGGDGYDGEDGGHALDLTLDVTIDNSAGTIYGGGGGGGGGSVPNSTRCGAGGGGGGAGTNPGAGGPNGWNNVGSHSPGATGSPGTDQSGGSGGGGGGGSYGGSCMAGGNGGGPGEPGQDGGASDRTPGSGGAAGYAVKLNGYTVSWTGGSTNVLGDVN